MNEIQGIESYVKSMSTTLYDKCWWVDKISKDIDTVVDFGCAQGDLALMLDRIAPSRFRYIGIDNSEEMLSMARHNHYLHFGKNDSEFYSGIYGIEEHCDPSKTVLVLNSVMHEIFSYLDFSARDTLIKEFSSAGFRYIAIRDMHLPVVTLATYYGEHVQVFADSSFNWVAAEEAIEGSKYQELWRKFNKTLNDSKSMVAFPSGRVLEFLLKYRYVDNWEREVQETYLWSWYGSVESFFFPAYSVNRKQGFSIPYIVERAKTDFGIDLNIDTHLKVLLELGK